LQVVPRNIPDVALKGHNINERFVKKIWKESRGVSRRVVSGKSEILKAFRILNYEGVKIDGRLIHLPAKRHIDHCRCFSHFSLCRIRRNHNWWGDIDCIAFSYYSGR